MSRIQDIFGKIGLRSKGSSGEGQGRGGAGSRWKKIALWVGGIIGVLLVIALIAPFAVDLNKYKGPILARIRPALNRNVDFESINLTVLTGIGAEINGLKIPENPAFAGGNFVYLESVQLKLKFLPLLRGQVRVAKLVFRSPVVNVRRNEQGVFNFSDMVKPKEKKEEESKLPQILASFGINELDVKDAEVRFTDRKLPAVPEGGQPPQPSPKNITVTGLDARVENISVTDPIDIDMRGILMGGSHENFSLTGQVGPIGLNLKKSPIPLKLVCTMDGISLKSLTEGLSLKLKAESGLITGQIAAQGSVKQRIDTTSKISVKELLLKGKPGAPQAPKPAPVACDFDGKIVYDAVPQDVTIESARLNLNGSRFTLAGKVAKAVAAPAWNIALRSTSIDTGTFMRVPPALGVGLPAGLVLKGPASLQLSTTGTKQDMAFNAAIEMSPAEIALARKFHKAPGVACKLLSSAGLKDGTLAIRSLNLALHNLILTGSGDVQTKGKPPVVNLAFSSKPMSLNGWDRLIPLLSSYRLSGDLAVKSGITGTTKSPEFKLEASSNQIGLLIPADRKKDKAAKDKPAMLQGLMFGFNGRLVEKKVSGSGSLAIKGGKFTEIALGRITSSFTMAPNRIDVPAFTMGVFGGTVQGSASYLTSVKSWSASPQFKGIDAGLAMNKLTSFKNIFSGTLSGRMQAAGSTAVKGLGSLATKGVITIDKGAINNIDILKSTIDGFTGIPGLTGLVTGERSAFQRNRETRFDSLSTDFELAKKVLNVPSMKLNNIRTGKETNSIATLAGAVDMVSRKLDFKGDVALSPDHSARLAKRAPVIEALKNAQSRVVVPIKITGTVSRPMLFLQVGQINQALANYYTKKGVEKGLEKLKKRLNIPEKTGEDTGNQGGTQKDSTKDTIDKLLRGFGK